MALRPGDLTRAELPRAFHGYDVRATRELLEEAADELKAAMSNGDRLAEKVRRLEEERAAMAPVEEDDIREQQRLIGETLVAATRAADDLREKSRREAEMAVAKAEMRAKEVLVEIEHEREELKAAAEKERQELLEQARAEARQVVAEAETRLEEMQAEAERLRSVTDEASANLRALLVGMLEQLELGVEASASATTDEAATGGSAEMLDELRPSDAAASGEDSPLKQLG
jgi:cell division septum initiation protein DivIVA